MTKISQAYQKYIRQSPRKLRLIADMIKGKEVDQALNELAFTQKKAARLVRRVLVQAKANAASAAKDKTSRLTVGEVLIEEGPRIKRFRPVSRGRAHPILKRLAHIKITLGSQPLPVVVAKGK